jgi:hypothetical protein
LAPPVVALVAAGGAPVSALATAAVVAAAVVVWAARQPGRALAALAVVLPFGPPVYAWLYAEGVPRMAVRPLSGVKEALAVGVVIAGLRAARAAGRRPDAVDVVVLAYVAAVTVHLVVPGVVADGHAPVLRFSDRLLGWRENAAWALLFLGARHAPLDAADRRRWVRVAVGAAAVVAACGVYQYAFGPSWRNFVVDTLGYPRYLAEVLNSPGVLKGFFEWIEIRPPRAGSVLFSAFSLGDYLLVALAIGLDRLGHRRARPVAVPLAALAAAGVVVSFTRAGMTGALAVAFVSLRPAPGRPAAARVRLALACAALLVLAAPGLADTRVTGGHGGARSSSEHVTEIRRGIETLVRHPLGSGLGTGAGTGTRLGAAGSIIADNTVIGVGNELGVVTMGLFAALWAVVLGRLRRAAAAGDRLGRPAWAAMVGLVVSGTFHHVFTDYAVAWTTWSAAGLALGATKLPSKVASPNPLRLTPPRAEWIR